MHAPIALFVYNRPTHTRLTVEALRRNPLASESDLFIFSDAARSQADADHVAAVRAYVQNIDGFRSTTVVEQSENRGLARSIIAGTTDLCERFGKAIVLEDDLETSPHFLRFMNDALTLYEAVPEVMHISGCTYPIDNQGLPNTYFLRLPLCWGWATWKRAWNDFEKRDSIMDEFDERAISRFTFDRSHSNYWEQLEANRDGKINTWFIFWYAKIFLSDRLVLFPKHSLVNNIGMDGTGVHCAATNQFAVELSDEPVELSPAPLVESRVAFDRHKRYFRRIGTPRYQQVLRAARRKLRESFA